MPAALRPAGAAQPATWNYSTHARGAASLQEFIFIALPDDGAERQPVREDAASFHGALSKTRGEL